MKIINSSGVCTFFTSTLSNYCIIKIIMDTQRWIIFLLRFQNNPSKATSYRAYLHKHNPPPPLPIWRLYAIEIDKHCYFDIEGIFLHLWGHSFLQHFQKLENNPAVSLRGRGATDVTSPWRENNLAGSLFEHCSVNMSSPSGWSARLSAFVWIFIILHKMRLMFFQMNHTYERTIKSLNFCTIVDERDGLLSASYKKCT